jgi:hypothetical protein
MSDKVSLAATIVSAVAKAEGVEPTAVRQSLFETVDTIALEELFRNTTGHVTFEYLGYDVTVNSEGDVSLERLSRGPTEAPS